MTKHTFVPSNQWILFKQFGFDYPCMLEYNNDIDVKTLGTGFNNPLETDFILSLTSRNRSSIKTHTKSLETKLDLTLEKVNVTLGS